MKGPVSCRQAVEDDATSSGSREDPASGRNLERPPTALERRADNAADSETEGALPFTHESERPRSNPGHAARSRRRSADEPKDLPSREPAESGQFARAAELVEAARGLLQMRLEDMPDPRDCERVRRGRR
jgi:hypothetical protein